LLRGAKRRHIFLSYYGPLSLLFLLIVWAAGLIAGFSLLHWADGSAFQTAKGRVSLLTDLYLSGSTFFSLGLGGVAPSSAFAKALVVVEAGIGFGFLAMVISYLPVIYQAFSRREITISLLDARAGSPPSAAELLRRLRQDHRMETLRQLSSRSGNDGQQSCLRVTCLIQCLPTFGPNMTTNLGWAVLRQFWIPPLFS